MTPVPFSVRVAVTLLIAAIAVGCGTGGVTTPDDHASVSIANARPDSTLDHDSIVSPSMADTDAWDIRMAYLRCCGQTQEIDILLNSGNAGVGGSLGETYNSRWESLIIMPSPFTFRTDDTTKANRIVSPYVAGTGVMFVYDVATHTLRPSPDRVLLVRTKSGNIFKFQFTSIYKDAVATPNQDTPLGFYHFRYQLAKNGDW